MTDRQHGDSLPVHNPSGNRGNHTIEGFNAVADEAARAAITQTAADRGRVVRQTGGTVPGWYVGDGATGWTLLGGGASTLQQAYDNGGNVDADVSTGTNDLRVRDAANTSDVLLRFHRNATGADAEQTKLKAPDATATGIVGTRLDLLSGAGKAGTGATDGSDGGGVVVRPGDGGAAVDGVAGDSGGLSLGGGKAGSTTGATATPGQGQQHTFYGGDGGDSTNDAVDGGDAGGIDIQAGLPGSGTGPGEGLSGPGATAPIDIGTDVTRAGGVNIGYQGVANLVSGLTTLQNSTGAIARVKNQTTGEYVSVYAGDGSDLGTTSGVAGDLYLANDGKLYVCQGGTTWRAAVTTAGAQFVGPIDSTDVDVAFPATPFVANFDLSLGDSFTMDQINNDFSITFSNHYNGKSGVVALKQDGTGGYKITNISATSYTTKVFSNGGQVNTDAFIAASAITLMFYKFVVIDGASILAIQFSDRDFTPDYT